MIYFTPFSPPPPPPPNTSALLLSYWSSATMTKCLKEKKKLFAKKMFISKWHSIYLSMVPVRLVPLCYFPTYLSVCLGWRMSWQAGDLEARGPAPGARGLALGEAAVTPLCTMIAIKIITIEMRREGGFESGWGKRGVQTCASHYLRPKQLV